MNISSIRTVLISSVAAGALVACAESEVSPVTTGTTDGEFSSNGLRFADESIIGLGDLGPTEEVGDESTLTLRAAKLAWERTLDDVTAASAKLVDLTITSTRIEGGDVFVGIEIDGEEALFLLSEGVPVESSELYIYDTLVFVEPKTNNVIVIYAHGDKDIDDDFANHEIFSVAGFETDPDFLGGKGQATYTGWWEAVFASILDDGWGTGGGAITIDADFDAATIDGVMTGLLSASFDGEIEGNGWYAVTNSDETATFNGDLILEGGAQLDGVIYGAAAEETAGTITVDADVDFGGGETYDISGAGVFVACENTTIEGCNLGVPLFDGP